MTLSIWTIIQQALQNDDSQSKWRRFLGIAVLLGGVAILLKADTNRGAVACALILSGASLFVGVLLGFLFGIPKTLRRNPDPTAGGPLAEGDYQPNTNLEEISDWLTKLIVGIGLVELRRIPELIES